MKNHPVPAIGKWYLDNGDKQLFEIVAIDDDDETIEIQYFDGAIEELDPTLALHFSAEEDVWSRREDGQGNQYRGDQRKGFSEGERLEELAFRADHGENRKEANHGG